VQVSELLQWLPERSYARRSGVSVARLARLRRENAAAGCWQRGFGTYLWNLQAMELVQKLSARKKASAPRVQTAEASKPVPSENPAAPEQARVTLKAVWRREDRLYRAQDARGQWLIVRTARWHPLGSQVTVEKTAVGTWQEAA
jgi:hypothetical protein